MSTTATHSRIEVADVKAAANGRMIDVLVDVAGINRDLLDGKHHPCPKCGGQDRFRLVDVAAGAVRCNACFAEKCGDFIAAIQWMTDQSFPIALRIAAEYLDMAVDGNGQAPKPIDIMTEFCRRKHIAVDSLKAYGATLATRDDRDVIRVAMFDEKSEEIGHQDYGLSGALAKGLTVKGEKAELFIPGRLPKPGETVLVGEGCKDSAALHAIGYFAIGTPGTTFKPAWVRIFRECQVVLVPDRDQASYKHFGRVKKLLAGVAASVGWVDLPFEMEEREGNDLRDLL